MKVEQLGLTPYHQAYGCQMQVLKKIHENDQQDDVCLMLEHPSVFTLGRNGSAENVTVSDNFLQKRGIEIVRIERGGEVTYHGPGQIICYPITNLRRSKLSIVDFVHLLENIMLAVVKRFGIEGSLNPGNHGIWIEDRKLGSIGIAVRHGISYHGFALNVNIDLEPFAWMNPCGLSGISMSSMEQELQQSLNINEVQNIMVEEINQAFGGSNN
jgi:lipoate-protein ligase B